MMHEDKSVKFERNDEHNECAAARLTAELPAAIATIAVAGSTAVGVVQALVQLEAPSLQIGRIHYGRWPLADGNSEQVVVCRTDAVTVELHCHGGQAVCQAILSDLQQAGCRVLPAEDWSVWHAQISQPTQPASCLIQQAAEQDLLLAQSERAAAILLDQANGAMRAAVERLLEQLEETQLEAALHELSQLLERSRIGLRLTTPWQVVLAGPPNVGKSSLSNALAGQARAIVHHEPGTTRDWLQTLTTLDGWPVSLTDTAGVRSATDRIEAEGVARARQRIAAADGVLLVVDGTMGWTTTHDEILEITQTAEIERFIVWNKGDLTTSPPPACIAATPVIVTSAVGAPGIDELIVQLAQWICPRPPQDGVAIPFRAEHVAALKDAQRELLGGQLDVAIKRMHDLLG